MDNNTFKYQVCIYGKGNKTRYVLLSQAYARALNMYMNVHSIRGDMPIFTSLNGDMNTPLNNSTVWRIVSSTAKKAGLGVDVSPHMLRHSAATLALAE